VKLIDSSSLAHWLSCHANGSCRYIKEQHDRYVVTITAKSTVIAIMTYNEAAGQYPASNMPFAALLKLS